MLRRFAVGVLAVVAGCSGGSSGDAPADTTRVEVPVQNAVQPVIMTRAQLAQFKWLEGKWRGSGGGIAAFFERYEFPNDSTMISRTYADSTFAAVSDSSMYVLADGQLSNLGEGPRWVATAIDDSSITFSPVARANNGFKWTKVSGDEWSADVGGRIYRMTPVKN